MKEPRTVRGQEHVFKARVVSISPAEVTPFLYFFTKVKRPAQVTVRIDDETYRELQEVDMFAVPQVLTIPWKEQKGTLPKIGKSIVVRVVSAKVL